MNANRRNNSLKGVMIDGTWIDEPHKVKEEVRAFFSQRFQEPDYHRPRLDGTSFRTISQHQNNLLLAPFQVEEVEQAV